MMPTSDISIVVFVIDLRNLRLIIIINGETSLMLYLERCQDIFIVHALDIDLPSNGDATLISVDGCDDPAYQCRGHASYRDGRFGCDVVSSIFFNSRDSILVDSRQVFDSLLIGVR